MIVSPPARAGHECIFPAEKPLGNIFFHVLYNLRLAPIAAAMSGEVSLTPSSSSLPGTLSILGASRYVAHPQVQHLCPCGLCRHTAQRGSRYSDTISLLALWQGVYEYQVISNRKRSSGEAWR